MREERQEMEFLVVAETTGHKNVIVMFVKIGQNLRMTWHVTQFIGFCSRVYLLENLMVSQEMVAEVQRL